LKSAGGKHVDDAFTWSGNWAWSIPLIIATVILHVIGLAFVSGRIRGAMGYVRSRCDFLFAFSVVMGGGTFLVILLHASEAALWAGVYWLLGALPDGKEALLYSLGAMTTYGHETYYLAPHWRLMGALEALNGMILFGLTAAFLYAMIRGVWPGNQAQPEYSSS
jgi:hypothetical protein